MTSKNKKYDIDYIIIEGNKKITLDQEDTSEKLTVTLDIILKEVE